MSKAGEKVVAYVRVSTKDQDRDSPELQLAKCQAWADDSKHPLTIVKVFREARSGYKAEARIEFYRMLEYIREHQIKGVIFAWRDRMQRNTEDYVRLKAAGVTLHDVEARQTVNPSDPDDYEATAAYEHGVVGDKRFSAKLSKTVRDAYDHKVKHGDWPHQPPLGYKPEGQGKDRRIVIDPVKGPLIVQMFKLFATGGYTRKEIARKMYDMGLRSLKGNKIARSQIETYLRNPFFTAGKFRWKGQEYDAAGHWPPLISKTLFQQVQDVFAAKNRPRRRGGQDYKYKGLLTCALCGHPYIEEDHTRHYFRCTLQVQPCHKMGSPRFKESELDLLLETAIDMLTLDPKTYEWFKSEVEESYRLNREAEVVEKQRLTRRLDELDRERARTWDGFKKGIMPDEAFLKEEFAKIADEKAVVQARLAELDQAEEQIVQNSLDVLGILRDFKNQYFSADVEKRRRMNYLLFRKVSVRPIKGTREALLADPKRALVHLQYPLEIEWKEPFDMLFDLRFQQELTKAGNEFFWKEHPGGGWPLRPQKQIERA